MFPVRQRHAERLLCNILAYTSKVLDFYHTGKTLKRSKRQVENLKNVSNIVLGEDLPSSMDTSSSAVTFSLTLMLKSSITEHAFSWYILILAIFSNNIIL